MPNWAEGNIRFRGKRENLIRFFTNELVGLKKREDGTFGEQPLSLVQYNDHSGNLYFEWDEDDYESIYFRGSNRQFVDIGDCGCCIEFSEGKNMNVDQVVIFQSYRAAWNVDNNYFKTKAQEYKIDIRTFVWEMGCEWSSVNTWYKDGKTEEITRTYSDWMWEASMPYYGG